MQGKQAERVAKLGIIAFGLTAVIKAGEIQLTAGAGVALAGTILNRIALPIVSEYWLFVVRRAIMLGAVLLDQMFDRSR